MLHDEVIPILDFGAQYAQLIARRVRECGVFSELVRPDISIEQLKKMNPNGLILSGGPSSVYEPNAPKCDPHIFELGVPVLGICYGVQLHPEVTHTPRGEQIFHNFVYDICHCSGKWTMGNFVEESIARIREQVGKSKVICGLSGGVDSSVVAALLHKAIGGQLVCIFVDNGLLRKNERSLVETTFRDHFKINLRTSDASEQFLRELAGVSDPQQKRKIIGRE